MAPCLGSFAFAAAKSKLNCRARPCDVAIFQELDQDAPSAGQGVVLIGPCSHIATLDCNCPRALVPTIVTKVAQHACSTRAYYSTGVSCLQELHLSNAHIGASMSSLYRVNPPPAPSPSTQHKAQPGGQKVGILAVRMQQHLCTACRITQIVTACGSERTVRTQGCAAGSQIRSLQCRRTMQHIWQSDAAKHTAHRQCVCRQMPVHLAKPCAGGRLGGATMSAVPPMCRN